MSAWDNFENWAEGVFNTLTGQANPSSSNDDDDDEVQGTPSKFGNGYMVIKDTKGKDVHVPKAGYSKSFRAKAQKEWARENEEHHRKTGEYFKERTIADHLGGKFTGVQTHREAIREKLHELISSKSQYRMLDKKQQGKINYAILHGSSKQMDPYIGQFLSKDEVDKAWSLEHMKYANFATSQPGFWNSSY